ncbi:MAG: hypothetical protein J3K34DRAFT_417189 [Monoraphidium minutum]|nr:MAG: hypothetical protein J3K34DRAFT_417189 [Monoraphidium minutum]
MGRRKGCRRLQCFAAAKGGARRRPPRRRPARRAPAATNARRAPAASAPPELKPPSKPRREGVTGYPCRRMLCGGRPSGRAGSTGVCARPVHHWGAPHAEAALSGAGAAATGAAQRGARRQARRRAGRRAAATPNLNRSMSRGEQSIALIATRELAGSEQLEHQTARDRRGARSGAPAGRPGER